MRSFEDSPSRVGEEATWADQDDDGQDREGERQVVARADVTARKLEDDPDQDRARHRAESPTETSCNRRGQRDEEEAETEIRVEGADALREHETCVTGDEAGEEEGRCRHSRRVDAGDAGELAVLGDSTQGLAELRARKDEVEGDRDDDRGDDYFLIERRDQEGA